MMKNRTTLIFAIAFCAVFIIAGVIYMRLKDNDTVDSYLSGNDSIFTTNSDFAKDFELMSNSGESVKLSDFKGKVVVLNFWASWCPPCQAEMSGFNKVNAEYAKTADVVFLMVNQTDGTRETISTAERYINNNGYKFIVLYDTELAVSRSYQAYSIPMTLIIDKEGAIVKSFSGTLSESKLVSAIEDTLKR